MPDDKNKIKEGRSTILDEIALDPIAIPKATSEISEVYGTEKATITPDEIRILGGEGEYFVNPENPHNDYYMYADQSSNEKLGRAITGFAGNAAAAFVNMMGGTYDPTIAINLWQRVETEFSNPVLDIGNKLQDWAGKQTIYRRNQNAIDPGDFGWWLEHFQQFGTSVGMLGASYLEMAVITALTGGLGLGGSALSVGRKAKTISDINKVTKAKKLFDFSIKAGNKLANRTNRALTYGLYRRHGESIMEAADTFKTLKDEFIAEGFSEERAAELAAKGASTTYKHNMPWFISDAASFAFLTYHPIKGTTSMFDKILPKNKLASLGVKFGASAIEEGVEEGYQHVAQGEGEYRAKLEAGLVDESSYGDRVNHALHDPHFYNAMIAGAFGGIMLGGTMSGLGKIHANKVEKELAKKSEKFRNTSILGQRNTWLKQMATAKEEDVENMSVKLASDTYLQALYLDEVREQNTNAETYKGFFKGLQELEGKTAKEVDKSLQEIGYTDEAGYDSNARTEIAKGLKGRASKFVENAEKIETLFSKNLKNYSDASTVMAVTAAEFNIGKLEDYQTTLESQLQERSEGVEGLSIGARPLYEKETTLYAINTAIKNLEDRILKTPNKSRDMVILLNQLEELKKGKEQINAEVESIKNSTALKNRTKTQVRQDNKVLKNIKKDSESAFINEKLNVTRAKLKQLKKDVSIYQSEQFKDREFHNTVLKDIKNTENIKELTNVKEAIEEEGIMTTDFGTEIARQSIEILKNESKNKDRQDPTQPNARETVDAITDLQDNEVTTKVIAEIEKELPVKETEEYDVIKEEDDFPFMSPTRQREDYTDEQKKKLGNFISPLIDAYQVDNFVDFMRKVVKSQGIETASKFLDRIIVGLEANNFTVSQEDINFVQNNVLLTIEQLEKSFFDAASEVGQVEKSTNEKAVENKQEEIDTKEIKREAKEGLFEIYDQQITPRIAHLSRNYEMVVTEKGVTFKDIDDNLVDSQFVNNKALLDFNKYPVGTKFTIEIGDTSMPVTDRTSTWEKVDAKPFNQKGLKEDSDEYWDSIPMVIKDENGEIVGLVHQMNWYNPNNPTFNIDKESSENIMLIVEKAKEENRKIREAVRNAKNKNVVIEIVQKSTGVPFRSVKEGTMKLSEASKGTHILVATNGTSSLVYPKGFEGLINYVETALKPDSLYHIRQESKGVYRLFMNTFGIYEKDETTRKVAETITSLVELHLYSDLLDNNSQELKNILSEEIFNRLKKLKESFPGIENAIGKSGQKGLQEYLNPFIIQKNISKKFPHVVVDNATGKVIIMGQDITKDQINKSRKLKETVSATDKFLLDFRSSFKTLAGTEKGARKTYDKALFKEDNANITLITIDGIAYETETYNYKEFLGDNILKSNVITHNVGTETNPVYTPFISPVVNFTISKNVHKAKTIEEIDQTKELKKELENPKKIENLKENEIVEEAKIKSRFLQDFITHIGRDNLIPYRNYIKNLPINYQITILNFLDSQLFKNIDFTNLENVNLETVKKDIRSIFEEFVLKKEEEYSSTLNALKTIANPSQEVLNLIEDFEKIATLFDILKDDENYKILEGKAIDNFKRKSKIIELTEDGDVIENEHIGNERNPQYDKSHLTRDTKMGSATRIKHLMEGIPQLNNRGQVVKGFLGLPVYMEADTIFNTLRTILNYSDTNLIKDNSTQSVVKVLQSYEKMFPWVTDLIDKLLNADIQTRIDFVNTMVKDRVTMKFFAWTLDSKTNSYTLQLMETNSNENTRAIHKNWVNSLIGVSKLGKPLGDKLVYDMDIVKSVLETLKNIKESSMPVFIKETYKKEVEEFIIKEGSGVKNFNTVKYLGGNLEAYIDVNGVTYKIEKIRDGKARIFKSNIPSVSEKMDIMFKKLGITLKPTTLEMLQKGYLKNSKGKFSDFKTLFEKFELFGTLERELNKVKEGDVLDVNDQDHFINKGVFKNLAKLESKYNLDNVPSSFRDNKKSISTYNDLKFFTQRFSELVNDESVRNDLLRVPYSKQSMWLKLLNENKNFREVFRYDHIGLTALKQMGKRLYRDAGLHNIDASDINFIKLGAFWNVRLGDMGSDFKINGIPTRLSTMLSPSMAGKDNVFLTETVVLNTIGQINKNTLEFTQNLKDILFEQLVLPELERIQQFLSNEIPEIREYSKGADKFFFLPKLNEEKINGKTILEHIKEQGNAFDVNSIKSEITEIVIDYVMAEAESMITSFLNNDMLYEVEDYKGNKTEVLKIDKDYIKNNIPDNTDNKDIIKLSILDFVINSKIANANFFMLFGGDIASYFKTNITETYKTVNKRLTNQQSPRLSLENSGKEHYYQLAIEDWVVVSETLQYYAEILDNKKMTNKDVENIRKALEENNSEVLQKYEKKFPKTKPYFKITATDAQEYTTAKEHLHVLRQIAKLSKDIDIEQINEVEKLLNSNIGYENMNKEQQNLLDFIFQPMKPIYTGQFYDVQHNIMRTVYVKSSSFPLLPWVTKGKQLDILRTKLEELEKKTGNSVRASYQTANKVGSTSKPLSMFDRDGNISESAFNETALNSAMIKLPRKYFGIQMDVPYDTKKSEIAMVTQATKILMSYVGDLKGFKLDGKEYTGKELQVIYNETFETLYKLQKESLYNRLGFDLTTGFPTNIIKTFKALQELLNEEASNRNWENRAKDGLKALLGVTVTYPDGKTEPMRIGLEDYLHIENKEFEKLDDERFPRKNELKDATIKTVPFDMGGIAFQTPLWLNAKADNIESLLTSIVSNKIAKMKIPGHSYVLGAEVGWKFKTEIPDSNADQVIYLPGYDGGTLKNSRIENGEFKAAQVLIPSRLKDNKGNLINLLAEEGKYFETVNGRKYLKTEMFAPEVLQQISFRIPTSKHSSLSTIEVVGFLPSSVGDLIIVPKDFTIQKGLDYDVDKEYTYQKYIHVTEEGKIVPLEQKYEKVAREDIIKEARRDLNFLLDYEKRIVEISEEKEALTHHTDEQGVVQQIEGNEDLIAELNKEFKKQEKILNKILSKYFTEEQINEAEDLDVLISEIKGLLRDAFKDESKLLKNKIIDIHQSLLSHPEIQKMVLESLNLDMAKAEAKFYEQIFTGKDEYYSILNSEYQTKLITDAASAGIGVGAYSLDVVLQGTLAQLQEQGKGLYIQNITPEGKPVRRVFNIAGMISDGTLGVDKTLDGVRTPSEVVSERQNMSVDDANENIMHLVNLNNRTFDFDKTLTFLGFDLFKGTEHSISFAILNQPIIREYVQIINRLSAVSNHNFSDDKLKDTIKILFDKYKNNEDTNIIDFEEYQSLKGKEMSDTIAKLSIESLTNNIITPDNKTQLAILDLFLDLSMIGKDLREISTSLNVDSKGIGISLRESNNKLNTIKNKLIMPSVIGNVSNIYGDFVILEEFENATPYLEKGYLDLGGGFYIKPSTVQAKSAINALISAEQLWDGFYPYNYSDFNFYTNFILKNLSSEEVLNEEYSNFELTVMQEILDAYKMYHFTDVNNKIFGENNIDDLRRRLTKDSETNTSLGKYLLTLKNEVFEDTVPDNVKDNVRQHIVENPLFKMFKVDFNEKNGNITTIEYNNADGKHLNEDNIYNAIIDMYNKNLPLLMKDGKSYSTRDLVNDLVAYAYLQGGIQKAIEFVKFIPSEILQHLGFIDALRIKDNKLKRTSMSGEYMGLENEHNIPPFITQFYQHNPQRAKRLTIEDIKKLDPSIKTNNVANLTSFKVEKGLEFYSVYNKNNKDKFDLYKYDSQTNSYRKIPTYTFFKMNQYNANTKIINRPSLAQDVVETPLNDLNIEGNTLILIIRGEVFEFSKTNKKDYDYDLHSNDIIQVLTQMKKDNVNPLFEELIDIILPYLELHNSTPTLFTGKKPFNWSGEGFYYKNTIFIEEEVFSYTKEEKQRVILHELLHNVLNKEINRYLDNDGNVLKGVKDVPIEIKRLGLLFQDAKKQLETEIGKVDGTSTLDASRKALTPEEMLAYQLESVKEFVTAIMTDKVFQEKMNNYKYADTKLSLYEKFKQLVTKVIDTIAKHLNLKPENITAQSIATVIEILEGKTQEMKVEKVKTPLQEMMKEDPIIEKTDTPYTTLSPARIKEGVPELFESNPELANSVYEALGFRQKNNLFEKNIFTVEPIQSVDKKAKSKAKIATQYIGFAEGIAGSSTALYAKQISEQSKKLIPVANIPQNLVSDVESFGTKQEANNKAKELLGNNPHSIDMIIAGIRTRTTRSVGEMTKYNVKVGDVVKQFGKSADGTTKQILTRITAIHPKGTPGFFGTWEKEGWTADGIKAIKRFKDGAAAIEFEVIKSNIVNSGNYSSNDVIFVSIGGKRGNETLRKQQQDKTIREAIKALEAGATLITDNAAYVESNSYNEGEKRLAANLKAKGYNYSETTVDGNVLGVWNKNTNQITPQQKQQAQQLYSQYLDTIFPDSKVKDIVYRADKRTNLTHQTTVDDYTQVYVNGVYYSTEINYVKKYNEVLKGKIYSTILNIKNPANIKSKQDIERLGRNKEEFEKINNLKYNENPKDSLIFDNTIYKTDDKYGEVGKEIVVFEPEQIHILGSKQDIEGFKEFVSDDISFSPSREQENRINYRLKATEILLSDKAKQVFTKGEKAKWDLNKILTELQIPKEQKQLLLDLGIKDREQLALELASKYSYTVEVNTAKNKTNYDDLPEGWKVGDVLPNSEYYSNLTVPGGTNYTENEISTPLITPSIKGHAQFSTDKGIGWFRSDEQILGKGTVVQRIENNNVPELVGRINTKTRRILEIQSDLFQKGRDREFLTDDNGYNNSKMDIEGLNNVFSDSPLALPEKPVSTSANKFLQLLNKDNNWVTFFIKSIIQDTAKQTITEVQESDVEAKVRELEKEGLLEIDCSKVKAKDGIRSKFTKGSQWEIVKDLKGYPSHSQGGVDVKIGKNGFSFTRDNGVIEAKYGLVLPKIK